MKETNTTSFPWRMESESMSPSLKQKLKYPLCISGCFRQIYLRQRRAPSPSSAPVTPRDRSSNLDSTLSPKDRHNRTKTKSPRFSRTLSKSQEKCRSLIHRIGVGGGGRHVRRHTTEFGYDALSYSLNFDKGDEGNLDQFPFRRFSSRLPISPPSPATATEISTSGREVFPALSVSL